MFFPAVETGGDTEQFSMLVYFFQRCVKIFGMVESIPDMGWAVYGRVQERDLSGGKSVIIPITDIDNFTVKVFQEF